MKHHHFAPPPPPLFESLTSYWLESSFPGAQETLVSFIDNADAARGPNLLALTFVCEVKDCSAFCVALLQRFFAGVVAQHLGLGFVRRGAHVHFGETQLTDVSRLRCAQTRVFRLRLFLPAPTADSTPSLQLTAMRMPSTASAFAAAVQQDFVAEHQEIVESALTDKLGPAVVRE